MKGYGYRERFTSKEKKRIIKLFYKLKKAQPELTVTNFALRMGINRRNLYNWLKQGESGQT